MSECGEWAQLPLEERIRRVCALRHELAENPTPYIEAVQLPFRHSSSETLAGEITPLADACAFLGRKASEILGPRRLGTSGRPKWLLGVEASIHREPLGTALLIAPRNYPLMLPGIQAVQALVAGNRVVWKPAQGTKHVADLLAETLRRLGVLPSALVVLEEPVESLRPWLGKVDKVFLTGSSATGRAVMRELAEHLVPSVMELSGCDPLIVLPDADLDLVASCVRFALTFNGSASCIAPRRVIVDGSVADRLVEKLRSVVASILPVFISRETRSRIDLAGQTAIRDGAQLIAGQLPCVESMAPMLFDFVRPGMMLAREDLMAPLASLVRVSGVDEALDAVGACEYRLGASVFGSRRAAREVARRIEAGSVVINDVIVPTADPRLPFGGSGESGFGVTRGAEGLLEMTRIKTISDRWHGPRFHLRPEDEHTAEILKAQLQAAHGRTAWKRLAGTARLLSSVRRQIRGRGEESHAG